MKKITALFILFAILLQLFSSVSIIVNYVVNKDYISKNLCENRNKPMMHCNGKCHLMKQLRKQSKKENTPINTLKEKNVLQFFNETVCFNFSNTPFTTKNFPDFLIGKTASASFPIFHPPTC